MLLIMQSVGITGYLAHFPVAQWSKQVRGRQSSQFAGRGNGMRGKKIL